MISHGILPILSPNHTKFVFFGQHYEIKPRSRKSSFSSKRRKCKVGKRDNHGKARNGHRKFMEMFCQVFGNPEEVILY